MTTTRFQCSSEDRSSLAPGPALRLGSGSLSAFHVCGTVGFALSLATWFGVTWLRGLSLGMMAMLVASGVATFLGFALLTKIIQGEEELIYYRHEIVVLLVAALVLWLAGQPLLAYLEIALLGVGVFLACGRVGCFLVGCCHGRPHSFGVRYGAEHADAGFPKELVGVRLLPVQLFEAAAVTAIVALGVAMVSRQAAPGTVLAWYSIVYGVIRFSLEFLRGDGARRYYGSFSEAQWTTLALMGLVGAGELCGVLPLSAWHVAVTALLAVFMVVWAFSDSQSRRLFRATHVQELAAVLRAADARSLETGRLHVGKTRVGLRLSSCTVTSPAAAPVHTLAFSVADHALAEGTARKLARLLTRLEDKPAELVMGRSGTYHLVFSNGGGERGV